MEFDNLDDLRVLLATAETGGLTAAGKRCGLSTAAVSAALKRLESSLGVRLFERTTRSVRATAEGEVMIDHARRALDLLSQGQAQVRSGARGLAGSIRISVAATLAREIMANWLAGFAAAHPGIEIDLQVSDDHVDLVREGIDLALRHGPLSDSSHTARLLAPARRMACASPGYLAACGRPAEPAELVNHDCLVYHIRGRRHDTWFFGAPGSPDEALQPVRVRGRLNCNDASIAHQWALQGRGVIYQSELALAEALRSGALQQLFPQHAGEPAPLYAVMPSGRFVPARVAAVVDQLSALFRGELAALHPGATTVPAANR
ncbi:MAG: LysR family transcriptional regulator [Ramlibacter sp.]|nr:LysR family transcriptional regulator [Ramlibacter sp.]MBX3659044.1 LysR family transcriptional regulator [Ramlibacter sp.]